MAMSPSPHISPSMGSHRIDRQRSNTPPLQPISKRDKRRTQLLDRLQDVTNDFNSHKDLYYRQQLQAIQFDTSLVLHALPYENNPLDEIAYEIDDEVTFGGQPSKIDPGREVRHKRTVTGAGKLFSEFANEVNNAIEERDTTMILHQTEYEKKSSDLLTSNSFMLKLAQEEHKALSTTLRDRLINSIIGRKARLNKDKEIENISESNALLLHPNQFSITNPASPGGMHGKRATRHRRDNDEQATESHKRKRKAVDDAGSPVPSRRLIDSVGSAPVWMIEKAARDANKGTGSPLYSIDKLFTEKELTMTYNQAAMAAHHYIVTHKAQANGSRSPNGSNESPSGEGERDHPAGDGGLDNYNPESPPSAPAMDRQYSHATRSTRGAAGLGVGGFSTTTGIDVISDLNLPANFVRMSAQMPKMPPPLHSIMVKGYEKASANSPSGVAGDELDQDLNRMDMCRRINEQTGLGNSLNVENGDRQLLAAALAERGKYPVWLGREKKEGDYSGNTGGGGNSKKQAQLSSAREEVAGGVPMSKQSSVGGSELGGVPMSRTGTGDGGSRRGGRRNV